MKTFKISELINTNVVSSSCAPESCVYWQYCTSSGSACYSLQYVRTDGTNASTLNGERRPKRIELAHPFQLVLVFDYAIA